MSESSDAVKTRLSRQCYHRHCPFLSNELPTSASQQQVPALPAVQLCIYFGREVDKRSILIRKHCAVPQASLSYPKDLQLLIDVDNPCYG